jgi:hypothetical protein
VDIWVIFGIAAAILVLIVAGKLTESVFGRAADAVGGLFNRASTRLGWPRGVQEDEASWGWNPPPPAPSDEPELIETTPGPNGRPLGSR